MFAPVPSLRLRALVLGARGAAIVAMLGATMGGCLTNRCLLSYCEGPDCNCSVATCGEGAAYDDRARQCRCLPGRALVSGQCVSPEIAATYCGPSYRFTNGGCYPVAQCRPGDELDRASGLCIPHARVNEVAQNIGVSVGAGQQLGCPPGQKLVIEGSNAACVPIAQTCAPDEVFDGTACHKPVAEGCPQGSAWDPAQARCVVFATTPPSSPNGGGGDAQPGVNVSQWASTHYGPDGGNGTPGFCNAFAGKPWSFGVSAGSTAVVRIVVALGFRDGLLDRGSVSTTATFANSGAAVIERGASEVQAAARAVLAPLVAGGGRASSPTVTTTVRCSVVNAARPQAVPATGGL